MPDEQQALVLSALRSASGEPVSFSALRAAGVEFPASIVSELELSGVAIERCRIAGGREPGVRLAPAVEPVLADPGLAEPGLAEPAAAAEPAAGATPSRREFAVAKPPPAATPSRHKPAVAKPPPAAAPSRHKPAVPKPAPAAAPSPVDDWSSVRRYRASPREGLLLAILRPRRLLAPVALVVAIAAIVAIVLTATGLGAGGGRARTTVAQRQRSTPSVTATTTHTATGTQTAVATTQPASGPPATPVSLTLASQLESQGHDLVTSGQYMTAVPVLKRALAATGEHVSACVDPDSTMCLTYAYALYDLGRALRLSGNAAAAVPILERRLQIDNQRPIVLAELQLARQGAT
jgi:hypothetical protein